MVQLAEVPTSSAPAISTRRALLASRPVPDAGIATRGGVDVVARRRGRSLLTTCAENEHVDGSNTCVACPTGYTRPAGDDPSGNATQCSTCAADYRVDGSNNCVACGRGAENAAGDDASGAETQCTPIALVEMVVVNDERRCASYKEDHERSAINATERAAMRAHTAATVRAASALFERADFAVPLRLVLVEQVDWCDGDAIDVPQATPRENYPKNETDPEALLDAFGAWRDANLTDLRSADVAHLFTARDLVDGTLGAARRWSACGDDAGDGCGAIDPSDPDRSLGPGECALDAATGETVCCHGSRTGAVSVVRREDAASAAAAIVAHEIGHQLGLENDGEGDAAACDGGDAASATVMAPQTDDVVFVAERWSTCSAEAYDAQIRRLGCLRRGEKAVCGNGIVEPGEECDCGADDCVAESAFARDAHCVGTTCKFNSTGSSTFPPPPAAPPPPAKYEKHPSCDSGCGVARSIGLSPFVTDVPANECLRCVAGYDEMDCSLDAAPYKGWPAVATDGSPVTRMTFCAWTGCDADPNATCDESRPIETDSETCGSGATAGTNRLCCEEETVWTCCGRWSCDAADASPPTRPRPAGARVAAPAVATASATPSRDRRDGWWMGARGRGGGRGLRRAVQRRKRRGGGALRGRDAVDCRRTVRRRRRRKRRRQSRSRARFRIQQDGDVRVGPGGR